MELTSILKFLENRAILVTGATGFLAKSTEFSSSLVIYLLILINGALKKLFICFDIVFAEKILRVQPNVKKLYLLLRAQDNNTALQRFNNEVHGYLFLFLSKYTFIWSLINLNPYTRILLFKDIVFTKNEKVTLFLFFSWKKTLSYILNDLDNECFT